MTVVYKSVFFPVKKNKEGDFPENLQPSDFGHGCAVAIFKNTNIEGKIEYDLTLNGLLIPDRFISLNNHSTLLGNIFKGEFVYGATRLISIDKAYHLINSLGTEASKRLLEVRTKAFSNIPECPTEFIYLTDGDLLSELDPSTTQALESSRSNRHVFLDYLTSIGFKYTTIG